MAVHVGPEIVEESLILTLDAANKRSYSGTGISINDLTVNNIDSTLENGSTFSINNNGIITTDGVDDYIKTPRVPGTGTSTASVSWCIWVKPNSASGNIMSMSSTNPQGSWNMPPITAALSKFRGKIWNNNYLFSTDNFVIGNWYYVCLVFNYDPTQVNRYQRLYVNGILQAEQTNIIYSSSNTDNFLFFGQQNPGLDNTGNFSGSYGAIQVYNKALSEAEIRQNFEATRDRYGI